MSSSTLKRSGGTLLIILALAGFAAPRAEGKTHFLMLDVSASMKDSYNNNLTGWLIQPLLASSAFARDDRVIVRWFDQRGDKSFNPSDPQRKYDGKYDVRAILNAMPVANLANGSNTDIPEALELTLQDIEKLGVSGDVLIWVVTDNEQDVGGSGSVDPFYDKVKDDSKFLSAYLYPLVNENKVRVPAGKNAMVLYLLQYSAKPSKFALGRIVDDVGHKISNDPVTWFPIEKGIELNEASIQVNDESALMIDGRLKLPDLPEGVMPDFTIRFPFDSKLRNLKIVKSRLTPQIPTARLPDSLEPQGDAGSWHGSITPTELVLDPGKRSVMYTTKVAGDMTLYPTSFWNAVWNPVSDPVQINFTYKLEDVDSQIDLPGLDQVKNLQDIKGKVRQSQKKIQQRIIPMSFQVQFNTLWRRAVVAGMGLLMLGVVVGSASLLLMKSRYQLTTPFGEQTLNLPIIGQSHITINADRAAVIKKRFGKITILPLGTYTVNGALKMHKLTDSNNSFDIENQNEGKRYSYTLSRTTAGKTPGSVRHDDFLE